MAVPLTDVQLAKFPLNVGLDKRVSVPECVAPTSQLERNFPMELSQNVSVPECAASISQQGRNVPMKLSQIAYEHKSLQLLTCIVEQNNQILNWIRHQNEEEQNIQISIKALNLPIQFPLHDENELKQLKTYLDNDDNIIELVINIDKNQSSL